MEILATPMPSETSPSPHPPREETRRKFYNLTIRILFMFQPFFNVLLTLCRSTRTLVHRVQVPMKDPMRGRGGRLRYCCLKSAECRCHVLTPAAGDRNWRQEISIRVGAQSFSLALCMCMCEWTSSVQRYFIRRTIWFGCKRWRQCLPSNFRRHKMTRLTFYHCRSSLMTVIEKVGYWVPLKRMRFRYVLRLELIMSSKVHYQEGFPVALPDTLEYNDPDSVTTVLI